MVRMVRVTALDIQVSLRNPTAMLEDSMTSVKTLYSVKYFNYNPKWRHLQCLISVPQFCWQVLDFLLLGNPGCCGDVLSVSPTPPVKSNNQ